MPQDGSERPIDAKAWIELAFKTGPWEYEKK